jgi:hypothetical protein
MAQQQTASSVATKPWTITGERFAACTCKVSPCPCVAAGGNPTEGDCKLMDIQNIQHGHYGDVDLSGRKVAMVGRFPGYVLDGNWEIGLVVDEGASDAQLEALQTIYSGQAGGTFAELSGLIGKFLGIEKAKFTFEREGEKGTASAGNSNLSYEPLHGPGGRTELRHGAVAFRDVIFPGKAQGKVDAFGVKGDMYYGEWSDMHFEGGPH